jgi:hypothetical protein
MGVLMDTVKALRRVVSRCDATELTDDVPLACFGPQFRRVLVASCGLQQRQIVSSSCVRVSLDGLLSSVSRCFTLPPSSQLDQCAALPEGFVLLIPSDDSAEISLLDGDQDDATTSDESLYGTSVPRVLHGPSVSGSDANPFISSSNVTTDVSLIPPAASLMPCEVTNHSPLSQHDIVQHRSSLVNLVRYSTFVPLLSFFDTDEIELRYRGTSYVLFLERGVSSFVSYGLMGAALFVTLLIEGGVTMVGLRSSLSWSIGCVIVSLVGAILHSKASPVLSLKLFIGVSVALEVAYAACFMLLFAFYRWDTVFGSGLLLWAAVVLTLFSLRERGASVALGWLVDLIGIAPLIWASWVR